MILNRTHGFIFVHVPKSAGTAVTAQLSKYTRIGDVEVGGTELGEAIQGPFRKRFGLHKHSTASEIKTRLGEEFDRHFSFAFVRNPFDRAVSLYRFLRKWKGPHQEMVLALTFEQFLESELVAGGKYDICQPQVTWVCDRDRRILVQKVGHVEAMDQSLAEILGRIDPKAGLGKVAKANASGDEPVRLSHQAKAVIRKVYADDFEIFGYDSDPL